MRLTIRVRPGSSRTRVGGRREDALVVAVTAPAVDGRATRAALDAVAQAFGVRPRAVHLVSGDRSRTKIVDIDGEDDALTRRREELLDSA
ncbi:MAG: DUF167 domain-containing protein [Kineosporiaceae bacterium]|nr:DUF167 domain-containing protein [Kineosporiaceae bacterium]